MNFQQLKSVREAVRRKFNLSEVGKVLFTSPPGVSRQILELEDELGITIFERHGKRLIGLTDPGKTILPIIERLLIEADNLRSAGLDYAEQQRGTLTISTTHTQARYVLPSIVSQFRSDFPKVRIALQQNSPEHIAESVLAGKTDIGIATEILGHQEGLISFPCYHWSHTLIVPADHPLHHLQTISLEDLSSYPLITYDQGFTGRGHIDKAFTEANIEPDIVLTAMDADVIKDYVSLGLGVGVIASMAFNPKRDQGLVSLNASHLFAPNTTHLAVRRGAYLRDYSYAFMLRFAPALTREEIDSALLKQG